MLRTMRPRAALLVAALTWACGGESRSTIADVPTAATTRAAAPPTSTRAGLDVPEDKRACLRQAAPLPAAERAVARALCSERVALGVPGALVAVARDGEVVLRFADGLRCRGRDESVDADTRFRIGSLTKMLTAATVYAQVEAGTLELDAPLGRAAARELGVSERIAGATLRQLLDHRAGLPEITPRADMAALAPAARLHALVGEPTGPANRGWRYSNGDYVLVGALLQARSHGRYVDALRTHVLAPLAMAHTEIHVDPHGDVACGHVPGDDGPEAVDVVADFERFAFGLHETEPAGAAISTADDLLRFAAAMSDRPAGPRPSWAIAMLAAVREHAGATGRGDARYAAGLERHGDGDAMVLRHDGNTGDFAASLVWRPSDGAAVVVLANAGVVLRATLAAAMVRAGIDPQDTTRE